MRTSSLCMSVLYLFVQQSCLISTQSDLRLKLRQVGLWLRDHKYHEFDQRYASRNQESETVGQFVHSFPTPRLRHMVTSVANACKHDVKICLDEIHSTYKTTAWGRLENHDGNYFRELLNRHELFSEKTLTEIKYEPFNSKVRLFQYRTTASYYMCYFTLMLSQYLMHFGERCDANEIIVEFDKPLERAFTYGQRSKDYRSSDSEPFSCAMLSFCPECLLWKDIRWGIRTNNPLLLGKWLCSSGKKFIKTIYAQP